MNKYVRSGLVFGGFIGAVVAFLYPIFIYPRMHMHEFQITQQKNREGVNQESIQPGGMKVWSDPFSPPKR
uniref:small integral membrane protein 20 n=1 Tax=Myxine glutinosa TaxID=7769 RepID=UPI00358E2495